METKYDKAAKIGSKEAYINVGIALGIDILILLWMAAENDYKWMFEDGYWWKMILAASVFVFVGQWIGKKCGVAIITGKRTWLLMGPVFALLIFIATVFISGFLCACLNWENWRDFPANFIMDALVSPLLMIVYSWFPIVIHGLFFGYRIHRKGKRLEP